MKNQLCRQLALGLGIASLGLVGTACKRDQGAVDQDQQTQAPPQDQTATDQQAPPPGDPQMGATEPGQGEMQEQPPQQGDMAQQPGEQPPGQQGELAQIDPQVVQGLKDLHVSHQAEIKMGELAQDKENLSDRSKQFAETLVKEHRDADEKLMTMTKDLGIELEEEPQIPANLQSRIDQLQKAEGPQFERQFAREQAQLHEQELQKLRELRSKANNEKITSHLDEEIEVMQKHVEQAKSLQGQAS